MLKTTNKEKTFYEGGPAKADLLINLFAAFTLVGLPFTFGAIVRALWLRYTITNKRVSVIGGWFGKDQNQIALSKIIEIRCVPRGFGFYGDFVLISDDGAKLEMRSVPNFRETEKFLNEKLNTFESKTLQQNVQGFSTD
tara:strand:- start:1090 stop:1506 length:417 start_codon:yes stop_codon:yes gene_type:complete